MPPQQQNQGNTAGLSFFTMVAGVMAALKLKERWDDYKQVSQDEEGGGPVRLTASSAPYRDADEESVGLLDTTIAARPVRPKRKSCCVCCGINCGLFWKAFGIVVGLLVLWNGIKLIMWAITPAPTGLENMPAFSSSLGCMNAPYTYNNSQVKFDAAIGFDRREHSIDIRGGAVGTFTIAKSSEDDDIVHYEMTMRTDDESLLSQVQVTYPDGEDGTRVLILTPQAASESSACSRYDLKMYIPRGLKKLHVASHTTTHLQFDPESNINLDNLFVTMYHMDPNNQILPHAGMHAAEMSLEVFRGWIVGEVSVVNRTAIITQRGDGVANLRVLPTPYQSNGGVDFPPSILETTTGAGRTDIFYISDKAFRHRPIEADHTSSRNADVYLTYKEAEFSGRVKLESKGYTATGLRKMEQPDEDGYTHYFGDVNGKDTITVSSRGWTGLYF